MVFAFLKENKMKPANNVIVSVPVTNYYSFITFLKSKRNLIVKSVVIRGVHIAEVSEDSVKDVFAYEYDIVAVGNAQSFVEEIMKTGLVPDGKIWSVLIRPISILF